MYKKLALVLILIIALLSLSACKEVIDEEEPVEDLAKVAAEYKVEGQSKYWKLSTKYIFRENNKLWVEGNLTYIGSNLPEKASIDFIFYDIEATSYNDGDVDALSISMGIRDRELIDSKMEISYNFDRVHELEVYEEAIGHGHIIVIWDEDGKSRKEKVDIEIIK